MPQKRFAVAVYDNGDLTIEFIPAKDHRAAFMDSEKFCDFVADMTDAGEPHRVPDLPFVLEGIKTVLWDELEWEVEIKEIPE